MNITFNDTYEIRSVIGRGGMSTVYLAEHKRLHTCWAVKEVREAQGARFDVSRFLFLGMKKLTIT